MRHEIKSELLRFARELALEEVPRFLGDIEEVRATAQVRLCSGFPIRRVDPDRLLSVEEASACLGVSRDYLYRHKSDYPFTRRMGRKLLFSKAGIESYIRQQSGLTARRRNVTLLTS